MFIEQIFSCKQLIASQENEKSHQFKLMATGRH